MTLCWAPAICAMLIAFANLAFTHWFIGKARANRAELRAQLQRTINQTMALAEENSLLRHQLLELQQLRGNEQEPT